MNWTQEEILEVLDRSVWDGLFPVFDDQFLYLGASRLSLFRSKDDWGLVFDTFGYSPPGGCFVTSLYTFGSMICNVDEGYRQRILSIRNPPMDMRFNWNSSYYPIESDSWQAPQDTWEAVKEGELLLRGKTVKIPSRDEYKKLSINLQGDSVEAFELMRWLSEAHREDVLCSEDEIRYHLPEMMEKILVLNEWRHPQEKNEEIPSELESFQQLAKVLVSNDPQLYSTRIQPNSHWTNWLNSGVVE